MFEITVTGQFVARHQLRLADGALEPLHEHEWHVRVCYAGPDLDQAGLLLDFVDVRRRLNQTLAGLDNANLNALALWSAQNPSAERVALYIAQCLQDTPLANARLVFVEVEEEPGCFARYFPGT